MVCFLALSKTNTMFSIPKNISATSIAISFPNSFAVPLQLPVNSWAGCALDMKLIDQQRSEIDFFPALHQGVSGKISSFP